MKVISQNYFLQAADDFNQYDPILFLKDKLHNGVFLPPVALAVALSP
jgi:hypothetical protein